MKLLAFVLIWVSLGIGAVAATTAYTWRVPEEGDDAFLLRTEEDGTKVYAELAAPAGKVEPTEESAPVTADDKGGAGGDVGEPGADEAASDGESAADPGEADGAGAAAEPVQKKDDPDALVQKNTELTPEVVATLRGAGVGRVRVKSFRLGRWTHAPYFGGACVGLLAGAMLTRLTSARDAKLADEEAEAGDTVPPERAVSELRGVVVSLLDDLEQIGDEQHACGQVTERLGRAIRDLVPSVADQRERLVGRMGLGSYASLMDVFAAAERQLNRAWSAAADLALEESMEALWVARERLAAAEEKLTKKAPADLPLG